MAVLERVVVTFPLSVRQSASSVITFEFYQKTRITLAVVNILILQTVWMWF